MILHRDRQFKVDSTFSNVSEHLKESVKLAMSCPGYLRYTFEIVQEAVFWLL
jgi:hypothetical protein